MKVPKIGTRRVTKFVSLPMLRNRKSSTSGFSMVELLVVLAIISVLVALALPSTIRTFQAYRLDNSVSAVAHKLSETRMNAIKRNRDAWLHIDRTTKTAQVRTKDNAFNDIDVGYPEAFPQGLQLDGTVSIDVRFDSMGRYSSGPTTFTLVESNINKRKDISISPAGKISVGTMY